VSDEKIIVFGDMFDLGKDSAQIHYDLGKKVAQYDCDLLLCIGEMAKEIQRGASEAGVNAKWVASSEKLVEILKPYLKKNCMILMKGSRGMHLDQVLDELKGV